MDGSRTRKMSNSLIILNTTRKSTDTRRYRWVQEKHRVISKLSPAMKYSNFSQVEQAVNQFINRYCKHFAGGSRVKSLNEGITNYIPACYNIFHNCSFGNCRHYISWVMGPNNLFHLHKNLANTKRYYKMKYAVKK